MSNDLLFSVIPREGKTPVVADERVKRVSKEARTKQLSDEEKETHDEERLVSEQQQYRVQRKQEGSGEPSEQSQKQADHQMSDEAADDDITYDSHGETEHHSDEDGGQPRIDTFS